MEDDLYLGDEFPDLSDIDEDLLRAYLEGNEVSPEIEELLKGIIIDIYTCTFNLFRSCLKLLVILLRISIIFIYIYYTALVVKINFSFYFGFSH